MRVQDLDDAAPPKADGAALTRAHIRGRQLRQRRRATRGAAFALCAIALVVGVVTIGGHEGRHTAMSVQPRPTVPSVTSVPSSSPTSRPSVGTSTVPSSIAIADQRDLFGLTFRCAVPPAADPVCEFEVLSSRDAGRAWTHVGGVRNIAYAGWRGYPDLELAADGPNVWVYGTRTFASHDGGRTFRDEHVKGIVSALVPKGDSVWATVQRCALCPTDTLLAAPVNGGSWKSLAGFPDIGDPYVDLARPTASVAYVVGLDTHAVLYRSGDAGHSWQTRPLPPPPPSSSQSNTVTVAALGADQIWMLNGGDAPSRNQEKAFYRSDDGGQHWILVADTRRAPLFGVGHLPLQGIGLSVTVTTSQRIWIYGSGAFIGSLDGGQQWFDTRVSTHTTHYISQVTFIDPIRGWAWGGDANFRTIDGTHWNAITP